MSIRKGNDIIASTPAVDTVPQQGSANVITSGAVYTALQDYVTLSTSQTITGNKAFNGATISTNSDIEFTSVVAGLISNRNGTKRNLITRTNFNEVNVGNPYDPTIILGSGVRPHYNTIEYLALYSDIPGNFTGATAGTAGTNGLVPAPAAGDEGKFLQGDGTWTTVDALPAQTGHSGEYLTTDGSTASWAPASGEPDNTTITKNASDKLQAVAVIDQNAGGIVKTWKGTLAEYNLLGTYSNDTEYIVTDDETGGASVYTKAEVDTLLNDKANTDLSNLTSVGKNISNWSSNVTNCITEIPQDIKLELNAGTLTLKAGSKVYVPNGAGVFDERVITQDKTNSFSWMTTGTYLLTYFTDSNTIDAAYINACYSGTSFPTPVNLGAVCYRTDENKVYRFDGSNWYNVLALPLALISSTGSGVSSIDQVFNGFGYIGSIVFALPGVKGLIPDGRNADGSLKNTEFTVGSVKTTQTNSGTKYVSLNQNGLAILGGYYETETRPSQYYSIWYKPSENMSYDTGAGSLARADRIVPSSVSCDNTGKITSFTPKTVFHAVDYNDTEYIANQASPSTTSVILTLGASGSSYTAPADGWVKLRMKASSNALSYCELVAGDMGVISSCYTTNHVNECSLKVAKGQTFYTNYNNCTNDGFRFIYDNGSI